ncbi:hypothetical protein [Psittacicella gerlachiana]|uniref:Uncharacterized protein n=1 Tax=Psittacicella gerlachiana TaxID=2028574 RepID=A0A3A1YJA6_9GAMM|nr:hypothetical protein [Psittacicella gerlachiana]RIY37516.1 hypothetical protein CKF59_01570 [Psittacicella gerlachiana]
MKKLFTRLFTALGITLVLNSCSNYSVVNVPYISNNYRYVTLQVKDYTLYQDLRDELARQDILVLDEHTSRSQLETVVKNVGSALKNANKQVASQNISYRPSNYQAQQLNDKTTLEAQNPLNITSIEQCTGANLNLACIRNFIPHVNIDSYSQSNKVLSRLADGSSGQVLYSGNIMGSVYIPTLGDIPLLDIQSDTQLNDDDQPLAQIRVQAQSTQLLKKSVVESIVGKIVFIFEDQTIREINKQ